MQKRPNFVVFITDQQRRDTIGAYGSPICRTPTIDWIAANGMRFDRAYTPTGLCSPVRSSLMSGVYPHKHRVFDNVSLHPISHSLSSKDDKLAHGLKASGYRLGFVGKWHVSETETPLDFGFEDYHSLGDYMTWRKSLGIPTPDTYWAYRTQSCERDPCGVETSRPAWICNRAIELIDKYAGDGAEPFFIRLDFHGPHYPNVVPEPFYSMYPPESIPPWPNADDSLDDKPAVQRIKKRHYGTDKMSWADWQPFVSAYFGEVSLIDSQAGRVIEHLKQKGLLENTVIVWSTDHGDTIGAHGICNKDYTMYDEIYRVPLIVRWPGVTRPGSVSKNFVHHFMDLCATFLDIAGQPMPSTMQGRSLVPILRGDPIGEWPTEAYCEFHGSHMGMYSMRLLADERFSYIYHTNDIDEFYDHETDPHEMRNLAEAPGPHQQVLSDMKRRMVSWMEATGDHLHNEWTVAWLTGDEKLALRAPGRRRTKW